MSVAENPHTSQKSVKSARRRDEHSLSIRPLHLHSLSAIERKLIGDSPAMRSVKGFVELVALCSSTVLLTGETGTGKEVVAHTIHELSERAAYPFVALNCGAIPSDLIESELFGHVKGAFTGAVAKKTGAFRAAHNGTIFLDEFGDMPPQMQVKLLRVLQERELTPVGAADAAPMPIDVRVIVATNKQLTREIKEGRLREDLYYRVNVLEMHLPPLRDRRDDIPALAVHLLVKLKAKLHLRQPASIRLDDGALLELSAYPWPGNIRELENKLERLIVLFGAQETITAEAVRHVLKSSLPEENVVSKCQREFFRRALDQEKYDRMRAALMMTNGHQAQAAHRLGMKPPAFNRLYKRLRQRLAVDALTGYRIRQL